MWRAGMVAALLVASVAGCGVVAPSGSSLPPQLFVPDRPLLLPTMGPACPRSPAHDTLPDVGLGIGSGPVWPEGFVAGPASVPLGANPIDTWYPIKILWAAAPEYDGAIRVRGQRIDGAGAMQFSLDGGRTLTPELRLPAATTPNAERQWPSYTLVLSTGCYAYQIDGADFSDTAVFEVVP